MDSDHMELGETGLVPTEYGFYDQNTKERLDHEGNVIEREPTKED